MPNLAGHCAKAIIESASLSQMFTAWNEYREMDTAQDAQDTQPSISMRGKQEQMIAGFQKPGKVI